LPRVVAARRDARISPYVESAHTAPDIDRQVPAQMISILNIRAIDFLPQVGGMVLPGTEDVKLAARSSKRLAYEPKT